MCYKDVRKLQTDRTGEQGSGRQCGADVGPGSHVAFLTNRGADKGGGR